eukprot:Lithocolla_globosa_v1_NODE_1024_length_2942_cov_8.105300.p1 type:complete len:938 gc:universal NODE_1024_length_2942_cov_8.105300:2839-26(-)
MEKEIEMSRFSGDAVSDQRSTSSLVQPKPKLDLITLPALNEEEMIQVENKTWIHRHKEWSKDFLNGTFWAVLMFLVTIFVLFVDNIVVVAQTPQNSVLDQTLLWLKFISCLLFAWELVYSWWCIPEYPFSFFFWLDVVALASFIPDLISLFGGVDFYALFTNFVVARAGRLAKASARVARVGRVVRVAKISKLFMNRRKNLEAEEEGEDSSGLVQPSDMGRNLTSSITNQLVLVVLLLYVCTLLLQVPFDCLDYSQLSLDIAHNSSLLVGDPDLVGDEIAPLFFENLEIEFLQLAGTVYYGDREMIEETIRPIYLTTEESWDMTSAVIFNVSELVVRQHLFDILSLLSVMIILVAGNISILYISNQLIIEPLEKILAVMRTLMKNAKVDISSVDKDKKGGETAQLLNVLQQVSKGTRLTENEKEAQQEVLERLLGRMQSLFLRAKFMETEFRDMLRLNPKFVLKPIAFELINPDKTKSKSEGHGVWQITSVLPDIPLNNSQSTDVVLQDGRVKYATIEHLFERLLNPQHEDYEYTQTLFLTHTLFTKPEVLLDKIIQLYCISPSSNPGVEKEDTIAKRNNFYKDIQKPLRSKAIHLLSVWIDRFHDSFIGNDEAMVTLVDVVVNILPSTSEMQAANMLRTKLEDRIGGKLDPVRLDGEAPFPIIPRVKRGQTLVFASCSSLELARQVTLTEFELFRSIRYLEILNGSWANPGKENQAPNVLKFLEFQEKLIDFVQVQILSEYDLKKRSDLLGVFIQMASDLLKMRNFSSSFGVLKALSHRNIMQLQKTWAALNNEQFSMFGRLTEIMSDQNQFKQYRNLFSLQKDLPSIPLLSVHLSDLINISSQENFITGGNQLVNFEKCHAIGDVLLELLHFQKKGYNFVQVVEILKFFQGMTKFDPEKLQEMAATIRPVNMAEDEMDKNSAGPFWEQFKNAVSI